MGGGSMGCGEQEDTRFQGRELPGDGLQDGQEPLLVQDRPDFHLLASAPPSWILQPEIPQGAGLHSRWVWPSLRKGQTSRDETGETERQ